MRMMPVVDQITELLEGQVNVFKIDIDQNDDLAQSLEVNATPTFFIYKDGEMVWRESGEMEGNVLLQKIQSYI